MSDGSGQQKTAFDGTQTMIEPWMEYWMKMFEQNKEWTQTLMAGAPSDIDPLTLRKEWLGAMTKSIDAYMRTQTFLEAMRRNSDAMAASKVTTELAKREMARQAGMPHTEDISGLYDRLQTANEVVLQKLSAIEQRLDVIEKKIEAKPKKSTGQKK